MKKQNIYKRFITNHRQDEFSHKFACWANNHNGWAKMKKANKKLAKKRLRREDRKEMNYAECGRDY